MCKQSLDEICFVLIQILRREMAEIRETSSQDKHVSISVGEKHKRELEQLIKEMEQLKRENKRMREDAKQKGKSS